VILLIDNYDSFSYNLYQVMGEINPDILVIRNDEKTVDEIRQLKPERIVLSPGPGRPENAGILIELVRKMAGEVPILGVCLGHQAICAAFGATVTYASRLMHGKPSLATLSLDCPIFRGLPNQVMVGRYHSLAADPATMPECLAVTAVTEDGEIMAVRHREKPVYGLQFHPESILTPDGPTMLRHFLTDEGESA